MRIPVQLGPAQGEPSGVAYRWDPDTDILSAQVEHPIAGEGMSGPVGLEGEDGSWLILDLRDGGINAIEVAVWPDVRHLASLVPPAAVDEATVSIPSRGAPARVASLEVDTALFADTDPRERIFHFRLGSPTVSRTVRLARDLLLDVDAESHITGVWLLNVPPFPGVA